MAVKPVTQFPIEISNEDVFASFKNVRHVTIKKVTKSFCGKVQFTDFCYEFQGNQSLGIMIIEGKHAEVGQGIFVSDIQEGSNAEKVKCKASRSAIICKLKHDSLFAGGLKHWRYATGC